MSRITFLLGALCACALLVALAGCGGGGGAPAAPVTLKAAGDNSVALVGNVSDLPAGVNAAALTLTPKAAADVPVAPIGADMVVAVECGPAGTVFTQPVNLVFQLVPARAAGEKLPVYLLSGGAWIAAGSIATVSADGNTATAPITHFSTYGLFAPQQTVLPGDKYFRFDTGVYPGGMPSEIMYNDVDQTLLLPHAAALAVNTPYGSISKAVFGEYDDSNGVAAPVFPAPAGKVYLFRSTPMGGGVSTYFKLLIISATTHNGNTYGAVTFRFEQILPPDIIDAAGEWSFAGGAHLSVFPGGLMMDYTPTAGASVISIDGNYTNSTTLVGTWTSTANPANTGAITVTLSKTGTALNATLTGTNGFATATLTGGTKP